ncbi:MAG: dienelactone hydrolase family protein [Rubrivivax sp.]|nr:dienelactone hydrolase family protein [Rubrivivax sp.]
MAGSLASPARAQAAAAVLEADLAEDVLMIPADGPLAPELEVSVYRPRGAGPFPLVVINHGRSPGPAAMQERYRPLHVAYEFVRRGYAVIVPMREGFARSGGTERDGSCDVQANGHQQARSVRRAVDWAAAQPWADGSRSVVIGQSHGGLATLAYGAAPHPGTRLLVNFAGGLRQPACADWEDGLIEAIGSYGKEASLPSIWFYADNDSHFRPAVWRAAHERFVAQGGSARLEAFGRFGTDGHALFGSRDGMPTWLPKVLAALLPLGLPVRPDPRFEPIPMLPQPVPLRHARADEADRLPVRGFTAREAFANWLRLAVPKAFAVSENGRHWASAWGIERPVASALEQCERVARVKCKLFAINGFVVADGDSGTD